MCCIFQCKEFFLKLDMEEKCLRSVPCLKCVGFVGRKDWLGIMDKCFGLLL